MPRATYCRDCGERITEAPNAHLPGYCGPCSIPEQQDRERGRSVLRVRSWMVVTADKDGPTPSWWHTDTERPVRYSTKREAVKDADIKDGDRVVPVECLGDTYLFPTFGNRLLSLADLRRMAGRNP